MPHSSTPPARAKEMAENAASELEDWIKDGLDPVYGKNKKKAIFNALCDFYPSLPWDDAGSRIAAKHLLDKYRPLIEQVEAKFNCKMVKDLQDMADGVNEA